MAFALSNLKPAEKLLFAAGICVAVLLVVLRFGSMAAALYLRHVR
jgi:hypothetical protein